MTRWKRHRGRVLGIGLLWFLLLSPGVFAEEKSRSYLEFRGSLGLVNSVLFGSPVQRFFVPAIGATLARRFGDSFLFGISNDLEWMRQYTARNALGDRSGFRLNYLSPTMAWQGRTWILKADYQLLGAYTMPSGLKYRGLSGGRISAIYPTSPDQYFGPFFEYLMFQKQASESTETKLPQALVLWQVGVSYSILLF